MTKKKSRGRKSGGSGSGKKSKGKYSFGRLRKLKINTISVYASSSDLFLKRDLEPIAGALSKVQQLNGYTFSWKSDNAPQGRQVGLMAQDVQKALPEALLTEGATLGVDYPKITALLVEAIKEQQKQIEKLSALLSQ